MKRINYIDLCVKWERKKIAKLSLRIKTITKRITEQAVANIYIYSRIATDREMEKERKYVLNKTSEAKNKNIHK